MVSTGPSDINGSLQPMPTSSMRSSSGFLGTQNGVAMSSQSAFPSHLSPRTQFNNTNMISNVMNVASPNQSFGHEGTIVGPSNIQPLVNEDGTQTGPNSCNGIAFNSQPSFGQSNMINSISSDQMNSLRFLNPLDRQSRQHDHRNFQLNQQQSQQNQNNFSRVKLEPRQIQQAMRTFKMDPPQQADQQSLFLQQQQQQQQQQHMLQLSRSSSQGPTNLLHQQRLLQFQQQQQQIALKSLPLQRSPSQLPALEPQNLNMRPPQKPVYEPGMCARRLTRYMYEQQHRPEDNNIEFWRKFVAEFFAPNAKKKWCVSMYGSGRQTTGILSQDVWQCEICNHKPGRGFEATAEVLPRLFKIKYESGTLQELLYIDMPREYQNSAGQIVLDYAKAIQESVFDQLRVVRDGQLRIVFSPELKICSWEFCARRHEELIPRRLLTPQVSQLGSAAQKYQASTQSQNAPSNLSVDLQINCNAFLASAKQVAKALEVPLVNDLGYSKRYVRCLQIAEVVNSMKDLIDFGKQTSTGPMESLVKFPRKTNTQSVDEHSQIQQSQQQTTLENLSHDQTMQEPSNNGAATSASHSLPAPPSTSSANGIASLLHQNSMNSRSQYPVTNNVSNLFFQPPTPTSSNNGPQNSPNMSLQQQALPRDDSQSSVQKIISQMITSTHSGIGNNGTDVRNSNRVINLTNGTGVTNLVQGSIGNNGMTMNGRIGTRHQQGLGFGSINGYNNNLQFDWKPSP